MKKDVLPLMSSRIAKSINEKTNPNVELVKDLRWRKLYRDKVSGVAWMRDFDNAILAIHPILPKASISDIENAEWIEIDNAYCNIAHNISEDFANSKNYHELTMLVRKECHCKYCLKASTI